MLSRRNRTSMILVFRYLNSKFVCKGLSFDTANTGFWFSFVPLP